MERIIPAPSRKEVKLKGVTIVPGKGMGRAYFVGRAVEQAARVSISRQDVGDQVMRFNEIREQAKEEYRGHGGDLKLDVSILNIYEHILDDPAFIGQVVETISTQLLDLETAIRLVSNDFIKRFNSAGTAYFRERSSDMVEICEKLISFLHLDDGRSKTFIEEVVLIVSRMFTPSDILSYDRNMIRGVVSVGGGKTSHAAILARAYGIPVVSGIVNIGEYIRPGDQVYVDADKSLVYVRPTNATIGRFVSLKKNDEEYLKLKEKWSRPVYTRDGIPIEVLANISLPDDVDDANEYGADGIGLVRTEYLLANHKSFPDESVQRAYYDQIFKKCGPKKHCVVRLMDIGGDKIPEYVNMPAEFNPFMGWRAIRILLERKDFFETQLSAIMKAGVGYNYSIMLPMVTTLQEWIDARTFMLEVSQKLGMEMPKTGILFEVPLAILEMGSFMKDLDFAAIGTNDLIQYLNAADRNNPKVNYLYNPIEPAFLKILRDSIVTARDNGKPISICGEMAGDPLYTLLLVGLGLKRFSVIPRRIPVLKELISRISFAEAAEHVSHMVSSDANEDPARWLKNLNKKMLGEVFDRLGISLDGEG